MEYKFLNSYLNQKELHKKLSNKKRKFNSSYKDKNKNMLTLHNKKNYYNQNSQKLVN